MQYPTDQAHWKKHFKVQFDEDEEILNAACYHKQPNVGQVLLWRAMSPGMAAKYFVLLTTKCVIIAPMNNVLSLKPEIVRYPEYGNVRIMKDDGALEVEIGENKPLRIYPETFANKLNQVDIIALMTTIRSNQ